MDQILTDIDMCLRPILSRIMKIYGNAELRSASEGGRTQRTCHVTIKIVRADSAADQLGSKCNES